MRTMRYAGVLTALALSGPCWADLAATPLAAAAAPVSPVSLIGGGPHADLRGAGDFRVRLDLGTIVVNRVSDQHGLVRKRLSSSMIDFFPGGEEGGFHLSFGGRVDITQKVVKAANSVANARMYAPKSTSFSLKAGRNRFSPGMTAGYREPLAQGMTLGVEGGALMSSGDPTSRALAQYARLAMPAEHFENSRRAVDPFMQVSLAYRF